MILIRNIRMKIGYSTEDVVSRVTTILHTKDIKSVKILKESLDSRRHNDIHYRLNVGVFSDKEQQILKRVNDKNIMLTSESKYCFPHIINSDLREYLSDASKYRPVIVGSGPAGYHAAVKLCDAGFKPIVLERGLSVENRINDVEAYWETGKINPDSNVCFGEGGAGTFSDGKLNTGNKDKDGYFKEVLDTFCRFGADESIKYKAKPHIGTDVLRNILYNMREFIFRCGGEVRFGHTFTDIELCNDVPDTVYKSRLPLYKISVNTKDSDHEDSYIIKTHAVILAIGHSARDTYQMLINKGFAMEQKPFAMGVRVEHLADTINKSMYGEDYKDLYGNLLPAADYKLVYHTKDEGDASRNVFSFCMCPGGYVVNSSSEEDTIVINGMSYSGRNGINSNSAIVVSVNPDDFPDDDPLSGLEYQLSLERAAYIAGEGSIPLQLYGDLVSDVVSSGIGSITPAIKGGWKFADLRKILPEYIINAFIEAMEEFGKRIKGFNADDTVVTAIESRTSSPVRIVRDRDTMMAASYYGIIPTGEGAGYAGGITSAAADGIKAAEKISDYLIDDLIESYKSFETAKYIK